MGCGYGNRDEKNYGRKHGEYICGQRQRIAKLKFTHVNEIKLCRNSYIVYENDCVHKELKFDVCMPTDTCHLKTINHIKHRF